MTATGALPLGQVTRSSGPRLLPAATPSRDAAAKTLTLREALRGRRLSPRELAVLRALADGLTSAETAHRLGIAYQTAKNHRSAMLAKLDARGTAHAVAIGFTTGLLALENRSPSATDAAWAALESAAAELDGAVRAFRVARSSQA